PTPTTLDEIYAANRTNATQAAQMAAAHGAAKRAAALRTLTTGQLLTFDGRGPGLVTEVLGDLAQATHIAVLVPGSDTSLDTYGRFRTAAQSLHQRLTRAAPHTAVIAWLGYETPGTISTTVASTDRADQAAPQLGALIRDVRRATTAPHPHISLLCHSYGSVVCAEAAPTTADAVQDIALLGSPGTGTDTAAALRTPARIWAARGADDWVENVPHLSADLFGTTVGFGTDPVTPAFGARVFAAGEGGHSDYFAPGSLSLTNLTRIVLGDTEAVTHAPA
ncbi:alpha/beta hydrolase family protein, partial [Streptomyces sp. 15-116A]|uniref:alpha/beta hydrolase family protein n=1 Tax=Streptomyces sp. 15-116A TaxID=2259035 RepID=UPI0021B39930